MRKIILVLFTTIFLVLCNTVTAYETIKPYVNDFAHTMTVDKIKDLNDYAIEIDNQTGFEIAVVTVTNTDGMDPEKLKQHIQILDWVLSDEPHTRGIDEILKNPIRLQDIPKNKD